MSASTIPVVPPTQFNNLPEGVQPEFALFDAVEVYPCAIRDRGTTAEHVEPVDADDERTPDFWCVYGHYRPSPTRGGLDALHDADSAEEAEAIAAWCRTQLTPVPPVA